MPRSNLREKYKFQRLYAFKGYVDENGFHMGPTIFYNINGTLFQICSYDPNIPIGQNRRVGHWKYYDQNGVITNETIYIR